MGGNTGNYSKTTIKQHPHTLLPPKKKPTKCSLSSSKAKSCTLIVILKSYLAKKEKKIHKEEMEGMKKESMEKEAKRQHRAMCPVLKRSF